MFEIEPGSGIFVMIDLSRDPEEEKQFIRELMDYIDILVEQGVDPRVLEDEYRDLTDDREDDFPAPEDDYEPDDPFENNGR